MDIISNKDRLYYDEKTKGWVVHKELCVGGHPVLIIKNELETKYRCKAWIGERWFVFATTKSCEEAMKLASEYSESKYFLYV